MTETKSLASALAAFQAELPTIAKANTATVRPKDGGRPYSYSYADLADISRIALPLLGKHGMAWTTKPTLNGEGKFVLAYKLAHGASGEHEAGEYPLPTSGTPQQVGSAITYARRYTLCCVTGIAPDQEDDDGAAASANHEGAWEGRPNRQRERQALLAELVAATDEKGIERKAVIEKWAGDHGGEFIDDTDDLDGLRTLLDTVKAGEWKP